MAAVIFAILILMSAYVVTFKDEFEADILVHVVEFVLLVTVLVNLNTITKSIGLVLGSAGR